MFEKAAQEDLVSQCHHPPPFAMSVILPTERHLGIADISQPVVRDRDSMRVACQIMQNVFGTAEGALGVDHPVLTKQSSQKFAERRFYGRKADGVAAGRVAELAAATAGR